MNLIRVYHTVIVSLLKGMFNMRPLIPKYDVTCDVCKVVEFLRFLHEIMLRTFKDLIVKLLMLSSLASINRLYGDSRMASRNKVVFMLQIF